MDKLNLPNYNKTKTVNCWAFQWKIIGKALAIEKPKMDYADFH